MKNIHVLTSTKPSRLFWSDSSKKFMSHSTPVSFKTFERSPHNIYITSDEEIKGDWVFDIELNKFEKCQYSGTFRNWKKIILTTDPELIADGVQEIDDKFLEWFVKNPTCEFVEIVKEFVTDNNGYWISIPNEEIEEAAERCVLNNADMRATHSMGEFAEFTFKEGAKYQAERMYSEEDFKLFARQYYREIKLDKSNLLWDDLADKCLEEFKKK